MKKKILAIILILFTIGTSACNAESKSEPKIENEKTESSQKELPKTSSYKNIKPEEAKKRLESEKGIVLLDVRTQQEYDEKHIHNSVLIPVDVIEKEAPSKLRDKNAEIFVYCRSGNRSVTASERLVKMGYTNVYNLGGIINWPYETESVK